MSRRWRCDDCGWIGPPQAIRSATHPFRDNDTVAGCPKCGALDDNLKELCDVPDCMRIASCGWPSAQGYRRTCHLHAEGL